VSGVVNRAIGDWEEQHYGRSTVKNTVAALVLVLDEAEPLRPTLAAS
jgi:hypothetical protein